MLSAALHDQGYGDFAVLGPFVSQGSEKRYAVTVHERGGEATRMVRGSFAALRKAIVALPRR